MIRDSIKREGNETVADSEFNAPKQQIKESRKIGGGEPYAYGSSCTHGGSQRNGEAGDPGIGKETLQNSRQIEGGKCHSRNSEQQYE